MSRMIRRSTASPAERRQGAKTGLRRPGEDDAVDAVMGDEQEAPPLRAAQRALERGEHARLESREGLAAGEGGAGDGGGLEHAHERGVAALRRDVAQAARLHLAESRLILDRKL